MKTPKIDPKNKLALIFLWIGTFSGLFSSCDVVEPDADLLANDVRLEENQLYVLSNNTTFIDLTSKISTNRPVQFSITSPTSNGKLSDLGRGLLLYSPSGGSKRTRDA